MTFAISLFLVVMQFLWKYVEDMIGKGLEFKVLGEMFMLAALQLIPLALPLSILLASIMMFGKLGESLELLAIKSAGISLLRAMQPLIVLVVLLSIGTFFFQNNAMTRIQPKFFSLLISIRQKSPEVEIPERTFYKEIDGYNLYVEKKDQETGMLYDVVIYDLTSGFRNMVVIVSDSAKMHMSEDKLSLLFTLHSGQQFHNFTEGSDTRRHSTDEFIPYARESFRTKVITIPYDDNFNRMESDVLTDNESSAYVSQNIHELKASIDSLSLVVDSINIVDRKVMKENTYLSFRNGYPADEKDSLIYVAGPASEPLNMDSILTTKELSGHSAILASAFTKADNNYNDYYFRSMKKTNTQRNINRQWVEWHTKFTAAFACLVFFFIGAPLGSIVRKGGLGMPIVISVVLFIIYYILNNIGYKMARDGVWIHWVGMWFSSMILLPLGIFLTYKAMTDSVIMSTDLYVGFFRRLFFIREHRNYTIKEVVIDEPDNNLIISEAHNITQEVNDHLAQYKRLRYKTYWNDPGYDKGLLHIIGHLDRMLNQLSNSQNPIVLDKAKQYPILIKYSRPFAAGSMINKILYYFIPVGIPFKLISVPFEKRINKDLNRIVKLNSELEAMLTDLQNNKAV